MRGRALGALLGVTAVVLWHAAPPRRLPGQPCQLDDEVRGCARALVAAVPAAARPWPTRRRSDQAALRCSAQLLTPKPYTPAPARHPPQLSYTHAALALVQGSWAIGLFRGPSPLNLTPVERVQPRVDGHAAWPLANPVLTCASVTDAPSNFGEYASRAAVAQQRRERRRAAQSWLPGPRPLTLSQLPHSPSSSTPLAPACSGRPVPLAAAGRQLVCVLRNQDQRQHAGWAGPVGEAGVVAGCRQARLLRMCMP